MDGLINFSSVQNRALSSKQHQNWELSDIHFQWQYKKNCILIYDNAIEYVLVSEFRILVQIFLKYLLADRKIPRLNSMVLIPKLYMRFLYSCTQIKFKDLQRKSTGKYPPGNQHGLNWGFYLLTRIFGVKLIEFIWA